MINNRQGGRRRGRGGQRNQNLGQPGGNRQDNRQRGNAAQLLEKYKSLARDAQLAGDRVQGEYYLQFAEHYFRMLGENRARFDEHRRQRGDDDSDEDGDDESAESEEQQFAEQDSDDSRPQRQERRYPRERAERGARNGPDRSNGADERISVEALPPAIGAEDTGAQSADDGSEEAPQPRRRTRRPRANDAEGEVAPAA